MLFVAKHKQNLIITVLWALNLEQTGPITFWPCHTWLLQSLSLKAFLSQKLFKLILTNDNYAVSSHKDWPTSKEKLLSLPHQSQKSTAHLSEMSLLGHEILMW